MSTVTHTITKESRRQRKAAAAANMPATVALPSNHHTHTSGSTRSRFSFFRKLGRNKSVSSDEDPLPKHSDGKFSVAQPVPQSPNGDSDRQASLSTASLSLSPHPPSIPQISLRQPTFHEDDPGMADHPMMNGHQNGYADANGVGRKLNASGADAPTSGLSSPRGGAIRFVETGALEPTDEYPAFMKTRTRSNSARTRRSSIYARTTEGDYPDGVDAGVGSKARRLSVQIPDDFLQVEECKLEDHFGRVARMRKEKVGEGGAATVQKMSSKTAGVPGKDKVFAVKEFRAWEPDDEPEREYERKIKSEYAIAKSLEHPNIVTTYRLCHSNHMTSWYHVMDYCDLGDLNDAINNGYFQTREDRTCMFKQLLRGVDYLHSRGIAHRDLKSENLLLTSAGCLKIADFGTSEVFSGKHPGLRNCRRPSLINGDSEVRLCSPGLVGSRPYMAPELIKRQDPYDPRAVDIWSVGIVLLTLMLNATPWSEASTSIKNFNIYCGSWDEWVERFPDSTIQLERRLPRFAETKQFQALGDHGTKCIVFGLLHPDPAHRWTAKEALECPIVADYPCCQQDGYSDDIRTRQRKALHYHGPPKTKKGSNLR